MGAGIDYGHGLTNTDHETGIRYGVISIHSVLQAWADSSEPDYGDDEEVEDIEFAEAIGFALDDGEYKAYQHADRDIFITKSPYYTYTRFCSPCAPGAGDLDSPDPNGVRAYCFAPDWFDAFDEDNETGKYNGIKTSCPYPVYKVTDGECVFVPEEKP